MNNKTYYDIKKGGDHFNTIETTLTKHALDQNSLESAFQESAFQEHDRILIIDLKAGKCYTDKNKTTEICLRKANDYFKFKWTKKSDFHEKYKYTICANFGEMFRSKVISSEYFNIIFLICRFIEKYSDFNLTLCINQNIAWNEQDNVALCLNAFRYNKYAFYTTQDYVLLNKVKKIIKEKFS